MNKDLKTIHRFTPQTCTLELLEENSPLSRLGNKNAIKDIYFKLNLDDPRISNEEQIIIEGDRKKLESLSNLVLKYVENFVLKSFPSKPFNLSSLKNKSDSKLDISLKPDSLTKHELSLGSLGNNKNIDKITLSSIQLFDLVSALEEAKSKIAILDKEREKVLVKTERENKSFSWLNPAVAMVFLVGLGAAIGKIIQRNNIINNTPTIATERSLPDNDLVPQDDIVTPELPDFALKPNPKLEEKEPISSTKKLPPPTSVEVPQQKPDIPDPAKFPLPKVEKIPLPTVKRQPDLDTKIKNNSSVESTIKIPPQETTISQEKSGNSETKITSIDSDTKLEDKKQNTIDSLNKNSNSPKESIGDRVSETTTEQGLAISSEKTEDKTNISVSKIPNLPQKQEVANYFKQKWQPPKELKQTIEYRLILNQNGTIARIIPIGKASKIFLDRTNIPLMGTPFVSPLKNIDRATVRLLLSPDGEVTTFLE